MANIKCVGNIETNTLEAQIVNAPNVNSVNIYASEIEVEGVFSALRNIGGGFEISDQVNVGIEMGRRDGTPGTPYIDFHTDGSSDTDYNSRILAIGNGLNIEAPAGVSINNLPVLTAELNTSENGTLQLNNGLILQWARFTSGYQGEFTLTFPVTFPNACLAVTYSQMKKANTDYDKTTILSITNEAVKLHNSSYKMNYLIFAVGY